MERSVKNTYGLNESRLHEALEKLLSSWIGEPRFGTLTEQILIINTYSKLQLALITFRNLSLDGQLELLTQILQENLLTNDDVVENKIRAAIDRVNDWLDEKAHRKQKQVDQYIADVCGFRQEQQRAKEVDTRSFFKEYSKTKNPIYGINTTKTNDLKSADSDDEDRDHPYSDKFDFELEQEERENRRHDECMEEDIMEDFEKLLIMEQHSSDNEEEYNTEDELDLDSQQTDPFHLKDYEELMQTKIALGKETPKQVNLRENLLSELTRKIQDRKISSEKEQISEDHHIQKDIERKMKEAEVQKQKERIKERQLKAERKHVSNNLTEEEMAASLEERISRFKNAKSLFEK